MMVRFVCIVGVWLAFACVAQAQQGKRIALLIGNQAYNKSVGPLQNPHNDIALVGKALIKAGFEVMPLVKDATRLQVLAQIRAYARKLQQAGPDAVGFFYYSGHGAAERRTNYLIPVDVKSTSDSSIWDASVRLSTIIERLKDNAPNAAHFIVFDACRNELITRDKSISKGFVAQGNEDGVYISFATAENQKATDVGENSGPYAKALAKEIVRKGQDHLNMFLNVKRSVFDETGQRPWDRNGLLRRVYFSGDKTETDTRDKDQIRLLRERLSALEGQLKGSKQKTKKESKVAIGTFPNPIEPQGISNQFKHGHIFKDCADCPSMIVVKGRSFMMGSPKSEKDRDDDEGPQRRVRINKLAVGRFEVTRGQFDKFVKAMGYKVGTECVKWYSADKKWEKKSGYSYLNPGFAQSDDHPATCINWNDAKSYVKWLSKTTGKSYRLLSEAEWEYVARGGKSTRYSFGDNSSDLCDYGNGADKSTNYNWRNTSCNDGIGKQTASVGSYKPNPWGLYDVHGNVWEWVEDCLHKNYNGAPSDGSAWLSSNDGDCSRRVMRGGSWDSRPELLRSANRVWSASTDRVDDVGFRITRTLGAASQ